MPKNHQDWYKRYYKTIMSINIIEREMLLKKIVIITMRSRNCDLHLNILRNVIADNFAEHLDYFDKLLLLV
jgi:hypothetical protein